MENQDQIKEQYVDNLFDVEQEILNAIATSHSALKHMRDEAKRLHLSGDSITRLDFMIERLWGIHWELNYDQVMLDADDLDVMDMGDN